MILIEVGLSLKDRISEARARKKKQARVDEALDALGVGLAESLCDSVLRGRRPSLDVGPRLRNHSEIQIVQWDGMYWEFVPGVEAYLKDWARRRAKKRR